MEPFYIILGWILGLLSPLFVDFIQKPYRRKKVRESLFVELTHLRQKLAATAILILQPLGKVDKKTLEWVKPIMSPLKPRFIDKPIAEFYDEMLALTDEQFKQLQRPTQDVNKHHGLKKFQVPFLDSQIVSLHLFTPEFQRLALTIRTQVGAINEEIDAAWFNYTKTFEQITPGNHSIAQGNIHNSNKNVAAMCRDLCDDIAEILERKK